MKLPDETALGLVRLDHLPSHVCAIVRRIDSEDEDVDRLKTLGVCTGRQIEITKTGDPLILRVFGSRLGMSASLAQRVWVEACSPDHCAMKDRPGT